GTRIAFRKELLVLQKPLACGAHRERLHLRIRQTREQRRLPEDSFGASVHTETRGKSRDSWKLQNAPESYMLSRVLHTLSAIIARRLRLRSPPSVSTPYEWRRHD